MRFDWIRPFMQPDGDRTPSFARDEGLPAIRPGAFATWAAAEHDSERRRAPALVDPGHADRPVGRMVASRTALF